jgi:hypothetical protein
MSKCGVRHKICEYQLQRVFKNGWASSIGSLLDLCKKPPMLAAVASDESDVWPWARLPKLVRSIFYTQILQNTPDGIALATGFSGSDCGRGVSRWNGLPVLDSYCPKQLEIDAYGEVQLSRLQCGC